MSRIIKFRAWIDGKMILPEYADWEDFYINADGDVCRCVETGAYELHRSERRIKDVILMQFTGLKDKNGKDIYYSGDLLRIIGYMGENKEYKYDCIYKVLDATPSGVSMSFIRLFNQLPDSVLNSYPISQTLDFGSELTFDHRNNCNEKVALNDIYSDGRIVTHYTNNIELIANVHENPELLK